MKDRLIILFWTIALTMLFVVTSRADEYAFKYGMGLYNGDKTGNIKIFALREEEHLAGPIYGGKEGGLWVDNIGDGRRGGFYGKYQMGCRPGPAEGLYGKIMWGVQLQSTTDTQLGGVAQFAQDAGIGLRDATSFIEAGYSHVSSAGIWSPNRGRDFETLSVGVRF